MSHKNSRLDELFEKDFLEKNIKIFKKFIFTRLNSPDILFYLASFLLINIYK